VYAGNYFACAIGMNDRAYCWGFGENGQLGNASLVSTSEPRWPVTTADPVVGPYPIFRDMTGGESHTCGLTITRSISCWGFNPDSRQFGAPSGVRSTAADASVGAAIPLTSTRFVEAGESFSCAVTLGGVAYCAGNNERGQVGNGATSQQATTTKLETGGPLTDPQFWSRVTTGERHGCAMPRYNPADSVATRTPWCWGANDEGQLGNGAPGIDSTRAGKVIMPAGVTSFDSLSIVAGRAHTCALTPDGPAPRKAYCWGGNGFGQLGIGGVGGGGARDSIPREVAGAPAGGFVRLFAGEDHTCGLTSDGTAYCWGRNLAGQLGDGTLNNTGVPTPVAGGRTFRNLALGERFTCGITGDSGPTEPGSLGVAGMIYCWGDNSRGQLGLGPDATTAPQKSPGAPVRGQR
jgi:alpha-tubulin suppressor-like RCC1 family protein